MNANTKSRLTVAFLNILLPLSSVADEIIDEIVVTADFRERPVSELPASVSIMDADFIAATAVQHFEELVNIVPNLNWSGDGHRARYFQIRGVGELEQYQGAPNPSIGFLIDDIDFSGIGTVATLFDMQSVEILRGSQGSRYGANALGGLIYMRSTMPAAERDGRVQITVANDEALSLGAAFGGALNAAETTTFRISAQKHTSDGYRRNTFLQRSDTNGRDETTLRMRVRFEPSDSFEANISVMVAKIDNGYDAFALDNGYTTLSDKPGRDAQESVGTSLRLDWQGPGNLTLTSVTAMADSDIDFSYDADWGNADSWNPVTYDYVSFSVRKRTTLSQELRLSAENWLVGFYALRLNDDLLTEDLGEYYDPFYDWAESVDLVFGSEYAASNIALFGQFDKDLGAATRVSAGVRVERRTADYNDTQGLTASPSETMWGGELSLHQDFGDAVTGFASLSKGYKAGGFNLGLVSADIRKYGAEELWTVEAGIKSTMLDHTLQLNVSIFRSRRVDQQVRTSFQLVQGDPASFGFATVNVDNGRTLGLEADVHWRPNEAWELYANVGLLDATLGEFPQLRSGPDGRAQAHAPRYTLAGGVVYRHPGGVFARLDATARDAFYFDVSHDEKSRTYELVNGRIGYESDNWLMSVWVRNLLDKNYAVRGFYFGNEPPDFPNTLYTRLGDPRQVGVTVEKRF